MWRCSNTLGTTRELCSIKEILLRHTQVKTLRTSASRKRRLSHQLFSDEDIIQTLNSPNSKQTSSSLLPHLNLSPEDTSSSKINTSTANESSKFDTNALLQLPPDRLRTLLKRLQSSPYVADKLDIPSTLSQTKQSHEEATEVKITSKLRPNYARATHLAELDNNGEILSLADKLQGITHDTKLVEKLKGEGCCKDSHQLIKRRLGNGSHELKVPNYDVKYVNQFKLIKSINRIEDLPKPNPNTIEVVFAGKNNDDHDDVTFLI